MQTNITKKFKNINYCKVWGCGKPHPETAFKGG